MNPLPEPGETPLTPEDTSDLQEVIANAMGLLGRLLGKRLQASSPPRVLAKGVYAAVGKLREIHTDRNAREERAVELGLLWGEQVCRAHGWHWATVDGEFAVVAPDGSAYVWPVPYVFGLLEHPEEENTTLLLFNMIGVPGKLPARSGEYLRLG